MASSDPALRSCCCGFNLRIGTIFIGWICLVWACFEVITELSGVTIMSVFHDVISGVMYNILNGKEVIKTPSDNEEVPSSSIFDTTSLNLVIPSAELILSVILLMGAHQDKVNHLHNWFWPKIVLTVLWTCYSLSTKSILLYPLIMVQLCFAAYFILVVKSYSTELLMTQNHPYSKFNVNSI